MSKLAVGGTYTMSAEKSRCGDRSWSHDLWTVLSQNATHAAIINAAPKYTHSFGADRPMVVQIDLFDWTPADDLLAAVADFATPTDQVKDGKGGGA